MAFVKFPMCLYKPGALKLAGLELSATTVRSEEELEAALADGWKADPLEAVAIVPTPAPPPISAPVAPPVVGSPRDELEAEARALGIGFNARTSDNTLRERIAAAKG